MIKVLDNKSDTTFMKDISFQIIYKITHYLKNIVYMKNYELFKTKLKWQNFYEQHYINIIRVYFTHR